MIGGASGLASHMMFESAAGSPVFLPTSTTLEYAETEVEVVRRVRGERVFLTGCAGAADCGEIQFATRTREQNVGTPQTAAAGVNRRFELVSGRVVVTADSDGL